MLIELLDEIARALRPSEGARTQLGHERAVALRGREKGREVGELSGIRSAQTDLSIQSVMITVGPWCRTVVCRRALGCEWGGREAPSSCTRFCVDLDRQASSASLSSTG